MKFTQTYGKGLVGALAAVVALAISANTQAQTQPGRAEVRAIKGSATYSTAGGPMMPLKVGAVLPPGTTIKTGPGSQVDLFLGTSAGVVRVTENTTLAIDKLLITDTGADTVIEVMLNLPDGTILGNVSKLSAASKYEVKVPNGVAGIKGTRFRISSASFIVLLEGTLVFVYVPPGGQPTPYTLNVPPGGRPVYFSPIEGVKPAPPDLVREVEGQFAPPEVRPPTVAPAGRPGEPAVTDPARPAERTEVEPERQPSPSSPD